MIDVEPAFQGASAEGRYSISVRASGLTGGQVIQGFNLLLGYDVTLIKPLSVTFSGALGDPTDSDVTFNSSVLDFDPVNDSPDGYGAYGGFYSTAVQFENASFLYDFPTSPLVPLQPADGFEIAAIEFEIIAGTRGAVTSWQLMDDRIFGVRCAPGDSCPPDNEMENFDVKDQNLPPQVVTTTLNGAEVRIPLPVPLALMLGALPVLFGLSRCRRVSTA